MTTPLQAVGTGTASRAKPETPLAAPRRLPLWKRLWRDRVMLMLTLPGLVYFLVFHYVPLFGYVAAFQDYQPYIGFLDSQWVGLQNFATMLGDPRFWDAVGNTLRITLTQLVLFFPAPIALALLLNSVISEKVRRFVQSVVYLPHFIGWVIIVSVFQQVIGGAGVLPGFLESIGLPRYDMMTDPDAFPLLVTLQVIWKDCGWGTIIFLAALLSINPELYEAAAMDGAGRWRRLWHVTLPASHRSSSCCSSSTSAASCRSGSSRSCSSATRWGPSRARCSTPSSTSTASRTASGAPRRRWAW
ncbi:ABC transporter permease subunit [Nonomuraea dietziae]|uniref:ABC transporter permease subunit n=1 Tax=Nonomuraea dietziae TaxID=65515 RepID=UPI0031CE55B6